MTHHKELQLLKELKKSLWKKIIKDVESKEEKFIFSKEISFNKVFFKYDKEEVLNIIYHLKLIKEKLLQLLVIREQVNLQLQIY